jgi:hypothetical protein
MIAGASGRGLSECFVTLWVRLLVLGWAFCIVLVSFLWM